MKKVLVIVVALVLILIFAPRLIAQPNPADLSNFPVVEAS